MKGVVVALLVAAAAFAPSPARADPSTAAIVDRVSDASAAAEAVGAVSGPSGLEAGTSAPNADPTPDPAGGSTVDPAAARGSKPAHTLPPTDTELPAVDSRD